MSSPAEPFASLRPRANLPFSSRLIPQNQLTASFSYSSKLLRLQALSFDIHTKCPGVGVPFDSSKSCICDSYEKSGGVGQLLPIWESPALFFHTLAQERKLSHFVSVSCALLDKTLGCTLCSGKQPLCSPVLFFQFAFRK